MKSFEEQYLAMVADVLNNGAEIPNKRTGTFTKALFDYKLVVAEDEFPFSTIRPLPPRLAFEEFWFFLNGKTDTKELEAKGINFWKGNTSREFLDSRGLHHLPEGDLGRAYSKQFRNFGGLYANTFAVDQVAKTFRELQEDPYSRRMVVTLWNPQEEPAMCITSCWWSHQFVVLPSSEGDVLHMKLINRSLDSLMGANMAVQQYRLYQIALAKALGFSVGKLSCDLTHVHLYENQFEYVKEMLHRTHNHEGCYDINRVQINKSLNTLEDILTLTWDDWVISMPNVNVTPFNTPRPPMVA